MGDRNETDDDQALAAIMRRLIAEPAGHGRVVDRRVGENVLWLEGDWDISDDEAAVIAAIIEEGS